MPALERGFQFGDGVYETLRTYGRVPFRLTSHIARLRRSAAALGIEPPLSDRDLAEVLTGGIRRMPTAAAEVPAAEVSAAEVSVRVLVTRGVSSLSYGLPAQPAPELYAFFSPLPARPQGLLENGVRVLTLVEEKAARFAAVKLMNGVPSILALSHARRQGAYEVLRVDRSGRLLEGFISNVSAVKGRKLFTAPVSEGILDGVTRGVVLERARALGLDVVEAPLPLADALASDELFLSHTSAGVVPVVAVDDRPIGNGRPGDVTRALAAWFDGLPAGDAALPGSCMS